MSALAFLGTGSDVGKSIVVTACCRILKNRGFSVAPFKAQNMSNNSYVTLDGGEMGRAQVVQAEACRLEPHTDMNPVLLKPNTDIGSQIVLRGKAIGNALASEYFKDTSKIREPAFQSLENLMNNHELVVIEGAGSCAEVNLRSRDFVNFETAQAADAPVILVADIDRGGVFAQIIGSLEVMPEQDCERVAGFIINKFRGDASLFDDGIQYLEEKTGLPVLGLIPYFRNIEIDSEDGLPLETVIDPPNGPVPGKINIACIRLPHISNFTDFNPLIRNEAVTFHYLSKPRKLNGYDALILPGTKNVRFDLQWLEDEGWAELITEFQGTILGICGGYQMLGHHIADPLGVEGEPGTSKGFGLLDVETVLEKEKVLSRTRGYLTDGTLIDGYEIHMGQTVLEQGAKPLVHVESRNQESVEDFDGAVSNDGKIMGCYFHGLFDFPDFRNGFLQKLDPAYSGEDAGTAEEFKQKQYDLLAEHFEKHLDMEKLFEIIFGHVTSKTELAPPKKERSGGTGSIPSEAPKRKYPAHFPTIERFNTPTIIFLTICAKDRKMIFDNGLMHELLINAWNEADGWMVGKYMILPDHIHLFCSPKKPDVSLKQWVRYWKSLVSQGYLGCGKFGNRSSDGTEPSITKINGKSGGSGSIPTKKTANLFQRGFWDTQLRQGEGYSEKWAYVELNPVRTGLIHNSADWKYQGELNSLRWLSD